MDAFGHDSMLKRDIRQVTLVFQEDGLSLCCMSCMLSVQIRAFLCIRPPDTAKLLKRLSYLLSFQKQIKAQLISISNTQLCLKPVPVDRF